MYKKNEKGKKSKWNIGKKSYKKCTENGEMLWKNTNEVRKREYSSIVMNKEWGERDDKGSGKVA